MTRDTTHEVTHETLLVVSTRGESIGKVIHHDGDETFLVEAGTVFPQDFDFHYESSTGVSDDGSLVYTLTEYEEEKELEAGPLPADIALRR
jgi:hypothetical protein